jgi:hypothetical protein
MRQKEIGSTYIDNEAPPFTAFVPHHPISRREYLKDQVSNVALIGIGAGMVTLGPPYIEQQTSQIIAGQCKTVDCSNPQTSVGVVHQAQNEMAFQNVGLELGGAVALAWGVQRIKKDLKNRRGQWRQARSYSSPK